VPWWVPARVGERLGWRGAGRVRRRLRGVSVPARGQAGPLPVLAPCPSLAAVPEPAPSPGVPQPCLAVLLPAPRTCPQSARFRRVQLALLQALIIINYEQKRRDALLLYLYEYVHVYLYTYKATVLYPKTRIFEVQGKKTLLKRSQ